MRKFFYVIFALILLVLIVFLLRHPLMQAMGNHLIKEDPVIPVDAAFVLSGDPYERTFKAAELFKKGKISKIITTGEETEGAIKSLGRTLTSAALMKESLVHLGVPEENVSPLPKGTSTYEESEAILGFASHQGYKVVMIISSKLHTRRINNVFKRKFRKAGIQVVIRGADPVAYKIKGWWNYERGLIMVNNEYVKLMYYGLKY